LVPNYSFEDTLKCPAYPQFAGYINNWKGGYPAYFNVFCSNSSLGSVPSNVFGFQSPHTGNAYTGIYTFIRADTSSVYYATNHNLRDYLQVQLSSSLITSTKYYMTFYVSLADSEQYACNNIGAYFSDSSLIYSPTGRKVKSYLTPQVTNDTANHLTDKINWMKISGSFIAKGGEQYVVIGNFIDDAHSDSIFVNSSASKAHIWTASYYYIDDVIVSADSNYADSLFTGVKPIVRPSSSKTFVYPNPANSQLNIEVELAKNQVDNICLYNTIGEKVICFELKNNLTTSSIANLPSGIYFYRITDSNARLIQGDKLIIIH